MISADQILRLVNSHLGKLLRVAEAAMPKEQFQAFRRLALDEFGRNGFGKGLAKVIGDQRNGTGWQIPHGKEDDHD